MSPALDVLEDAELVDLAKGGDAEAFGELYERYAPKIFRFVYASLNNRWDAEDVTEEVFIRAWRSLDSYNKTGVPFSAFIYRIARNIMIDEYRGQKGVQPEVSIEEHIGLDDGHDPTNRIEQNLENIQLLHAVQQLRKEYQEIIILRFMSELSAEEIAEITGQSIGSIRVLQHRALNALKKLLMMTL
jgi:RNA polymerase sigma-70 factor, ECF subfamily